MRSSKYHDYRALKIALFIILVILGLFIYIKCIRAPLEHTAGEDAWTVLEEATCTEDGLRCKICTECGEEFDHEVIPATGHTENGWIVDKEATCTEDGIKHLACKNCNVSLDAETIPATGHSEGGWTVVDKATCTEDGLKVKLCKDCDYEFDREVLNKTGHTFGSEHHQEVVVDSTHTQPGTYTALITCTKCKYETKIEVVDGIEPKGHTYSWELKYDETTGEFTMVGTCDCNEEGNVVVIPVDGSQLELDTTIPSCCRKIYKATIIYEGVTITRTVEVEPDPHSIKIEGIDAATGAIVPIYVHITKYAKYDELIGEYYDHDIEGMIFLNLEGNEWDENGFALGAFKCAVCEDHACPECDGEYWYIVNIYSPEHDTRLNEEDNI